MSKETLFDRRIVARNIALGRVSRKEFDQYLSSLVDATERSVPMFSQSQSSLDDDEDEDEDLDDEG